jgi:hypothetical protein
MAMIFIVAVLNLALGYSLAVYLKHGALPTFTLPARRPPADAAAPSHDQAPAAATQ